MEDRGIIKFLDPAATNRSWSSLMVSSVRLTVIAGEGVALS